MTRRLNPQDRVDELGDATVPFNFDVHAMIFSDDAPALEAALHRAFEDRKLNMVNQRREFFYVTLNEIKAVIRQNFDRTVEFTDVPDAEQYRASERMRCQNTGIPTGQLKPARRQIKVRQQPKTSPQSSHSPAELLYTKWGTYEMPEPYTIQLKKGPRKELKKIEK